MSRPKTDVDAARRRSIREACTCRNCGLPKPLVPVPVTEYTVGGWWVASVLHLGAMETAMEETA